MIDFFVTNQVYKTESISDTFIVDAYLVELCICYGNHLLVVNGDNEQINLSPFDLAIDEMETKKTYKKKYKFDKEKHAIKFPQRKLDEIELMLLDRFGWSWFNALRNYITTDKFLDNISHVNNLRETKSIYPSKDKVLRCFKETNFDLIEIVFVGQDSYPGKDSKGNPYANGNAFATDSKDKPVSLLALESAIKQDMDYDESMVLENNLQHLVKQNIFLFNTSLTVEKSKPGSHAEYWSDLTKQVLSRISTRENKKTIFVLFGAQARGYKKYIDKKNVIFEVSHPASASYNNDVWDSQGLFKNVSDKSNELFGHGVKWIQ